jgi:hypothetical protein
LLDIACTLPFEESVVIGDSAVRNDVDLRLDDFRDFVQGCGPRPGLRAAQRVARFLDGKAANPAESRARVFFHTMGFPAPITQFKIERDGGRRYYADFKFDDPTEQCAGILGELDGKIKYSGAYGDGREALWAEKRREDEIRAQGYLVFRFGVQDLIHPQRLLRHMRQLGLVPGPPRAV